MRFAKCSAILLLLFVGFAVASAGNFWQATSITGPAAVAAGPDGTLFYSNRFSLYRSTNNGVSWDSLFTLNVTLNDIRVKSNGHLFVSTEGLGVIRSTDNGTSWTSVNSGMTVNVVRTIAFSPAGDLFVATKDAGVFRSTNEGDAWVKTWTGPSESNVSALAINAAGMLFAGVKGNNGIYKSTDNGATWAITAMTTSYRVYSLTIQPNGYIYAGTAETYNGVYRSTDDGATWSHSGLAGMQMNNFTGCVAPDGALYMPTSNSGFYRTMNNGTTWEDINTGLPVLMIFNIASANGYLFAGTSSGIFRSVNQITGVRASEGTQPAPYALMQNYPNPFNPGTDIEYRVTNTGLVNVAVFDILGKNVGTLVHEVKAPGVYHVAFDASPLPSGVYYYQMKAGAFHDVKKMLLAR